MRAFSSDEREALVSALMACGAEPDAPARRELVRALTSAVRAEGGMARFWPPDAGRSQHRGDAFWREAAQELISVADRDTATANALTEWLRNGPVPPPPARTATAAGAATANSISGNTVLHGPVVQARDIHGGVHFHPHPGPRPRAPVPHQLPPVTARFVDREADRRALDALRAGRPEHAPQLLVVSGLAGAGKTSFVCHWLREHADGFPDGQLYADLSGHDNGEAGEPASPATVLESFLIALGVASVPAGLARRSALWRSTTSGLKLAVVLDNASTAAQVRPLLSGTPTGLTVVTSRNALSGLRVDGAAVHRLEGLPTESAVELLAAGGGMRVAREPHAAREVVRLCGRLPLAVGLASAQLAVRPHRTLSALADSLAGAPGAVGSLRADGEAVMRTALDLSYGVLPRESAALYRRMGLLPTDHHDLPMLIALAGEDGDREGDGDGQGRPAEAGRTTDDAVLSLLEAYLLEETGPDTYRFHDLVRPHARRLGEERESRPQRDRVRSRFAEWCMCTAASAESILTPSHRLPGYEPPTGVVAPTPLGSAEEAITWLDTHRNGLMGAVRLCSESGWHASCWRLTDLLWPLFLRLRPTAMWVEAHRLGLDAARRDGSRAGEGRMLTSGAIGLRNAGQYVESAQWYRRALVLAVEDGDPRQQAQAISGLGHVALLGDRLDEAREHFEEALRLRESLGYRRGAALSRRRLGETAYAGGDLTSAAAHLREAAAELTELGEDFEAVRVLAHLGHVLALLGERDTGAGMLWDALARFRTGSARSEHWEARCLEWLGMAAESRNDRAEAVSCYEAARDLLRRLSPADAQRLADRLRRL